MNMQAAAPSTSDMPAPGQLLRQLPTGDNSNSSNSGKKKAEDGTEPTTTTTTTTPTPTRTATTTVVVSAEPRGSEDAELASIDGPSIPRITESQPSTSKFLIPVSFPQFQEDAESRSRLQAAVRCASALSTSSFADSDFEDADEGDVESPTTPDGAGDDAEGRPVTPVAPPRLEELNEEETEVLMARILKQIDFYFGDASFPKDRFLLKHCRQDPEGYINLEIVARFKKMKKLVADWQYIITAVAKSQVVKLNHDKTMIRRRQPVPRDPEDALTRTLVLEHLPDNASDAWIRELCAPHGRIAQVRVIRPVDSLPDDVRKYCISDDDTKELHSALRVSTAICALVEFEYKDQANKAIEAMNTINKRQGGTGVATSILYRKPKSKKEGEKKRRRRRNRNRNRTGTPTDGLDTGSGRASPTVFHFDTRFDSTGSSGSAVRPRCQSLDMPWRSRSNSANSRSGANNNKPSGIRSLGASPRNPAANGGSMLRPIALQSGRASPMSRSDSPCWRDRSGSTAGSTSKSRSATPVSGNPSRSASPCVRTPSGPDGSVGFSRGRGRTLSPTSA